MTEYKPDCPVCGKSDNVWFDSELEHISLWDCKNCRPFFCIKVGSGYAGYNPSDADVKRFGLKGKKFKCNTCQKDFGFIISNDIISGSKCPLCQGTNTTVEAVEGKECFTRKSDPVNHPSHYADVVPGIECIDVTQHFDFCIGNVIKYLWRCGHKDGNSNLQEMKKAQWYLNKAIEIEEAKIK